MKKDQSYIDALHIDREIAMAYYQKGLKEKPQQVAFLEDLLEREALQPSTIADVCCGSGTLAVYLARLYPEAEFSLVELNPEALSLAETNTRHLKARCEQGDIHSLRFPDRHFDLVICWQSLLDLEDPKGALLSLVRVCKPGGKIVVGSLFNHQFDVDIFARVVDHTRPSSLRGISLNYNTISLFSVRRWLDGLVSKLDYYPFEIGIDLPRKGAGLGTHTVRTENGARLQISAGMLMNWGVVVATR